MQNENEILDGDFIERSYSIEPQHIISVNKFILISILTLGLYEIWWIYKAWKFFQQKEKTEIYPAARAILSIIYLRPLFDKILFYSKLKGYDEGYTSISLFAGFFIANLLSKLPDPYWLISVSSVIFLVPPFKALNFAKQNSTEFLVIEVTSFSPRQIMLIVIGVIFWGMVFYGMSLEE
jgi:hypothetical protein